MPAMDGAQKMTVLTAMNYSAAAEGYAAFWSPVILPPARQMLQALPWDGTRRILDIGTGTGALIPEIRRLAPIASVMGIDPSLGMLARARGTHAPLAAMDAMTLGVRADAFDVAVLAFVLFHVPDPLAGLAEVRRVLRRGGTVGMTTWAEEPATPASQIWDEEFDRVGAVDPSPQPRRDELVDSPIKVRHLLEASGFLPGRVWTERVEYQWTVPRFAGLRTGMGVTKRKLETLAPKTRQACLDRVEARMSGLGASDLLCRGAAICATAAV
jgi:SAM-dependent methyltransferase